MSSTAPTERRAPISVSVAHDPLAEENVMLAGHAGRLDAELEAASRECAELRRRGWARPAPTTQPLTPTGTLGVSAKQFSERGFS